jgi:hypothetical protein
MYTWRDRGTRGDTMRMYVRGDHTELVLTGLSPSLSPSGQLAPYRAPLRKAKIGSSLTGALFDGTQPSVARRGGRVGVKLRCSVPLLEVAGAHGKGAAPAACVAEVEALAVCRAAALGLTIFLQHTEAS